MRYIIKVQNYVYDFLKASEKAAIACYDAIGKQDKIYADKKSVDSLRKSFNQIEANINIVSGEGILDNAPTINLGEGLGYGSGLNLDVALDPIDGTTMTALNKLDAMVVLAVAPQNSLLVVPDMYMEKLISKQALKDSLSLNNTIEENIKIAAKVLKKDVSEVVVGCLNKPRHDELKTRIKNMGAKIRSVDDGDVSLSIITGFGNKCDFMYVIGGAPEGITSAVITKCFHGNMQARLILKKDLKGESKENIEWSLKEQDQLNQHNLQVNKIYTLDELCMSEEVFFVATNITDGSINHGVEINKNKFETNSIVLTAFSHQSLKINSLHEINDNMNHFVK